uniref:C-type lectin domain-containing protein n=1 Tax=Esox lucius TaxID=8010 RepID=A0A3P8ZTC0_ESOLU
MANSFPDSCLLLLFHFRWASNELRCVTVLAACVRLRMWDPEQEFLFARSCYFISTQKGTWKNSRRDCQGRGADLAVITSPEEQAFMKSLNYGAWLGLTSADAEGAWMWVDGTTLTTGYWNQGEPSNAGGTEDSLLTSGSCHKVIFQNTRP